MTNQNIYSARKYISDNLSSIYPREEIMALTKIILLEASKLSPIELLSDSERILSVSTWDKISKICAELKDNRPIQYILGKTEFFGIQLRVNEHTLIPRQETEELVSLIIRENKEEGLNVIDVGTGSGAIAIALSRHLKNPEVMATDISEDSLIIARENSQHNKCTINFTRDNILDSKITSIKLFDLVVSNPPYVMESEKKKMHKNILDFEPHTALFVPDSDPLRYYRALGESGMKLLKKGGSVYFEINEALGNETGELISRIGYKNIRVIKDLNNKDRIISAKK